MQAIRREALPAILALALVATACSPAPVRTSTAGPGATTPATSDAGIVEPGPAPTPVPSAIPAPGHELYGFVPYWEMDDGIAAHLRATPLTTVALFSVTTTSSGAVNTGLTGYKRITGPIGRRIIADAHARGTRVELVYTSFGLELNQAFFADTTRMEATIASLATLVRSSGVDGVDVDIEGYDETTIAPYGAFVARLRERLVSDNPRATVSTANTGGPLGAVMAHTAIEAGVDRIFVMGYDYRFSASAPGAEAPLLRSDGGERSLTWTLDRFVAEGVPPERTLLGLPLYGMAWPVAAPVVVGAVETGPGLNWILRNHIALLKDPSIVPVIDPVEQVAVYLLGSDGSVGPVASVAPGASPMTVTWTAIYIDTPATLGVKLGWANGRGLAGAGFWAVGYERGLPAYTDLMRRFTAGEALP